MKTVLWVSTLMGLLPLVAYSVVHISGVISFRRAVPQTIDDESTVSITISKFQLGESGRPVVVSPNAWPSALCLFGAASCLVGLWFLIPRQPIYAERNGYDRIEPLLKRVLSSTSEYPSLIVSARDGEEALLVMRDDDGWQLSLSIYSQNQDGIQAIRQYFSDRDIVPSEVEETHDEEFDVSMTHLAFPLSGNATTDAGTCIKILRDIIGVTNDEPMEFTVQS